MDENDREERTSRVIHSYLEMKRDKKRYFLYNVARNRYTTSFLLRILAKNNNWWIQEGVAGNINTPLNTLRELAQNSNEIIRGAVVYNRRTPIDTLEKLAIDEDSGVRNVVAMNPNTPLEIFAKNEDKNIRMMVAHTKMVIYA